MLDFTNKDDSVSVFCHLTTAELTSKLQNTMSLIPF